MSHIASSLTTYFSTLLDRGRLLVVTDIDGTIVPINSNPDIRGIDQGAKRALSRLVTANVSVAIITGRSASAAETLVGVSDITIVGTNGAEFRREGHSTLVPEFEPHAARISRHLGKIFTWLVERVGSTRVRRTFLGDLIVETPRGSVVVEQKGLTFDAPYGVSHMYYFADFRDKQLVVEAMNQMKRWYELAFTGVLSDLVSFEAGGEVLSFTPLLKAPKWQALVRLVQQETQRVPLKSIIYFGDSDADAPALRMVRMIDRLTDIRATGVVIVNDATTRPGFERKQAEAIEAATVRLNEIHENVAALSLLASLAQQSANE